MSERMPLLTEQLAQAHAEIATLRSQLVNAENWNRLRADDIITLGEQVGKLHVALEHVTELLVDTWDQTMDGDPETELAVIEARKNLTLIDEQRPPVNDANYCPFCDLEHRRYMDEQGLHHFINGQRYECAAHSSAQVDEEREPNIWIEGGHHEERGQD